MAIIRLLQRDFLIARKSANGLLLTFVIMLISIVMYSFISPEKTKDGEIFLHTILITLSFANLLSSSIIFSDDLRDGSLYQLLTFGITSTEIIIAKTIFHFLISALPIIILAPIFTSIFKTDTTIINLVYVLILIAISLSSTAIYSAITTFLLSGNALIGNLISLPLMIAPLIIAKLTMEDPKFFNLLCGVVLIISASTFLMSTIIFKDNITRLK